MTITVAVAVAVAVLLREYSAMLRHSLTPPLMRGGVAQRVLLLLFHTFTWLRRVKPEVLRRRMREEALDTARRLESSERASERGSEGVMPARPGGVMLVGSSTFTYWRHSRLQLDLAPLHVPVYNAAFGGSCTEDVVLHMERLCTQHMPQVVVYFCGTNDVAQGLPPSSVLQGFELFLARLHEKCPDTHVIYLGVTVTPFFVKFNINGAVAAAREANALVENFCNKRENASKVTFITTDSQEEETIFASDPANYLGDLHHLNDKGHHALALLLMPSICAAITSYG